MTLLSHLGHPLPRLERTWARPADLAESDQPGVDGRAYAVQRLGALGVGLFLVVFGLLGATAGVPFLSTHGAHILGMSSNGLLSALSPAVAALLVGAAFRGPRVASTAMIALGVLFLVSALVNLALLRTAVNPLAFRLSNVAFSAVVGLLLLMLGAYGRISGNLPARQPLRPPAALLVEPPDLPSTPEELAVETAMREAEVAVVQHRATEEQRRRVQAMSAVRTRADRRRIWLLGAAQDSSLTLDA